MKEHGLEEHGKEAKIIHKNNPQVSPTSFSIHLALSVLPFSSRQFEFLIAPSACFGSPYSTKAKPLTTSLLDFPWLHDSFIYNYDYYDYCSNTVYYFPTNIYICITIISKYTKTHPKPPPYIIPTTSLRHIPLHIPLQTFPPFFIHHHSISIPSNPINSR